MIEEYKKSNYWGYNKWVKTYQKRH
jgi:hypothetical protein